MILEKAIIIAGGKGTRLEEKTKDMPKPLVPVGNKPILERNISWLKKNNVYDIIISVAYKKEKIKEYFGDGKNFGVKIRYTEHDENGGTEDAFKAAIEQSGIESENFYAMNADQLTDLQLEGFTNFHARNKAIATVLTVRLRTNFGIIEVDEENKITKFQEKFLVPNVLMNSGIYIFNKEIKDYLSNGNIEENTFRKLIEKNKIRSFFYDGLWLTINTKRELEEAEKYINYID